MGAHRSPERREPSGRRHHDSPGRRERRAGHDRERSRSRERAREQRPPYRDSRDAPRSRHADGERHSRRHDERQREHRDSRERSQPRHHTSSRGHEREELRLPPPPPLQQQPEREARPAGPSSQQAPPPQQQQQQQQQQQESRQRWGRPEDSPEPPPAPVVKQAPNMGLSGKLAAETNKTADGSAELKYQPPPEARVCKRPHWLLYCFKGKEEVGSPITLNQMPFYLFGKDRKVADIPTDHPSCSRQHAVLCFREVSVDAPDGIAVVRAVKPYLLDLESINGTTINGERVEPARYYELLHADVVRFGLSSREYVVMDDSRVTAAG